MQRSVCLCVCVSVFLCVCVCDTDHSVSAHQGITVTLMMASLYAQKRQRELGWYPDKSTV